MKFIDNLINPKINGSSKAKARKINLNKDQLIPAGHQTEWFENIDSIFTIRNNFYILKNADISAGFTVELIDDETLLESEYATLYDEIQRILLNVIPAGCVFHSRKLFLEDKNSRINADDAKGFVTKKIMTYHTDRPIQTVTLDIYISFPYKHTNTLPNTTMFSGFKKILPDNKLKDVDDRIAKAEEKIRSFINSFNSLNGMSIKRQTNQQLYNKRVEALNLIFNRKPNGIEVEYTNNSNYLKVGGNYVSTIHLSDIGENIFISKPNKRGIESDLTYRLGSLVKGNHIINTSIKLLTLDQGTNSVERKANMIKSSSFYKKASNNTAAMFIDAFIEEISETQSRVVQLSHSVTIWHHNLDTLKDIEDEIINAYGEMNGSIGSVSTMDQANYFFSFLPGNASSMFHEHLLPTEQAVCFLSFTNMTKGDDQGMVLANRNGELIYVDFWHPKLPSKNRLILGPTGSGKSFFGNNIIIQSFEAGYYNIIFDIGGSYKNIVELHGGKYIEFDPKNPIAINPFLVKRNRDGDYILDADKKTYLRTIISVMWKDTYRADEEPPLTKEETAIFDKFLTQYYEDVNAYNRNYKDEPVVPMLGEFIEFVNIYYDTNHGTNEAFTNQMDEYFRLTSFNLTMEKWVHGEYSSVFNSPEGTQIGDNKLTCIDFSNIKKNKELYPVMSLLMIELVLDTIETHKDYARIEIFLDEFFEMLTGAIGEFTEKMFRQIRKNNGAATILTQSVIELTGSPVAAAIVANSPVKILLRHNKDLFELTQEVLGLSNHQMELLKSLRYEKGRREAFVDRNGDSDVYMVDVGPHATKVYSTTGDDRSRLNELSKTIKSKEAIINQMVSEDEEVE